MKPVHAAVGTDSREKNAEGRKAVARHIIEQAHDYMVCDLCWAILPKSRGICPFCAAYRFDHDPDRVIMTALAAGARDLAVTEAYYPRIKVQRESPLYETRKKAKPPFQSGTQN
jgi:hypothetical protein